MVVRNPTTEASLQVPDRTALKTVLRPIFKIDALTSKEDFIVDDDHNTKKNELHYSAFEYTF